ncbi:E3 ubiquitin-protein ligase RNF123-like isoform X1 [Mizuhopecten yessoensis]|uniref:E3 ubiquitin-protein ligase RNF123-like isoform X1 n=1 Tax=Mizuhopecten yessoensis TaxID=6573 RepID=UPI000B45EF96|nr:E3 ubiquitin-protein ligase RNF123-like isoform X1 [Mizuhopecten yessoensis]
MEDRQQTAVKKDPYTRNLLDKVFPTSTDLSSQACASFGTRELSGLETLQTFLDKGLKDVVAQECENDVGTEEGVAGKDFHIKPVSDGGRISFGEVEFDIGSNVGTMLVDSDRLGLTSYSNFSTMRANCCVCKGKWVYELMLGSKGVMQLGWCTLSCKFSYEEGVGDTVRSYAYDGSRLRKWNVKTHRYGEQWLTGDVITCALDCDAGTATFYRNGKSMGVAFTDIQVGSGLAYFPAVSLSQGENLHANFGATPLRYPIAGYRPLQDVPYASVAKAHLLFSYLENIHTEMADSSSMGMEFLVSDKKSVPPPKLGEFPSNKCSIMLIAAHIFEKLAPLLRSSYVVEACLLPFLLKLCDQTSYKREQVAVQRLLDQMWSLMQDHELKSCFENLLISLLQCYRFSSVTENFCSANKYLMLTLSVLQHATTRRYLLIHVIFDKVKFPIFMHIKPPDDVGLQELVPTVWWDSYDKEEDKPRPPKTEEEKSRHTKYMQSCEHLKQKIEAIEDIQVEILKVLLIHKDIKEGQTSRQIFMEKFRLFLRENSGMGRTHQVSFCPLPVMLCFFHRMVRVVRHYWDLFQEEDQKRFVFSDEAYVPIHEFWSETRNYMDFQRCGGLVSHLNRILGDSVNKAQGLSVQADGKVVSVDKKEGKATKTGTTYPELQMPSGNSLMELLDGIVLLYHIAAHKQLTKMGTLRDNMKEYVTSLEDTESKLEKCPEQLLEVKAELERARGVFLERVLEQGRQIGWVIAVIYSQNKQADVAWLFGVVLRTISRASQFHLLFQYTPEFYIETAINIYNCLKNYFHPTSPFDLLRNHSELTSKYAMFLTRHFADSRIVNTDVRDNVVQALACFICYPQSLKILEDLPDASKESMIKSLIMPYENRSWAQTNWILVRIWKGCGFGFRYTHLPHLVPSRVQPTEFGFASLQKPCPSKVFQDLFRTVLLRDKEAAIRFVDTLLNQLNWSFSEFIGLMQEIQQRVARTDFRILESRQLKICATCFEIAVYLLRVLEMVVNVSPEIFLNTLESSSDLLLGRVFQVLCQVLNRVTTRDGMFDTVVSMYIQGLESVSHFPILAATIGILDQLLLKSGKENRMHATKCLVADAGFQVSALEFLLGSPDQPQPTDSSADKHKFFSLQKFEEVSEEEMTTVRDFLAHIKHHVATISSKEEVIKDDELCTICYAFPLSAKFTPCGHLSCRNCISYQMMRKKECFFCKVVVTEVCDLDGKVIIQNTSVGSNH